MILKDHKRGCTLSNMHDSDFILSDNSTERKNKMNLQKFQRNVMYFANKFIAKLYLENTDRKTIHDIISSINTFFFSVCLNQLQSEYKELIDLCGKNRSDKKLFTSFQDRTHDA